MLGEQLEYPVRTAPTRCDECDAPAKYTRLDAAFITHRFCEHHWQQHCEFTQSLGEISFRRPTKCGP